MSLVHCNWDPRRGGGGGGGGGQVNKYMHTCSTCLIKARQNYTTVHSVVVYSEVTGLNLHMQYTLPGHEDQIRTCEAVWTAQA